MKFGNSAILFPLNSPF